MSLFECREAPQASCRSWSPFYFYSSKALDGVVGVGDGIMVLRDGKMLGGTEFFYFIGTYTCSGGNGKVN